MIHWNYEICYWVIKWQGLLLKKKTQVCVTAGLMDNNEKYWASPFLEPIPLNRYSTSVIASQIKFLSGWIEIYFM